MTNAFSINEDLVNKLYERIRSAAEEVIVTTDSYFSLSPFLYNVVAIEIYPKISQNIIRNLVEICFWASLEREEGTYNNFSIVFQPPNPDDFQFDLHFKQKLEFNITNLKKLAPAFNSVDYQIGVWFDKNGDLYIWGVIQKLFWFLTITSIAPGKVLVNCLSGLKNSFKCPITSFETGFINPFSNNSNPVSNWLNTDADFISFQKRGDLQKIIFYMFNYGRGGAILLVKENNFDWKTSMKEIPYENNYLQKYSYGGIVLKYETYKELTNKAKEEKQSSPLERENFKHKISARNSASFKALNAISDLTKIDGATVLSENLEVMTFGAKIGAKEIEKIAITQPFENSEIRNVNKTDWKVGTRHSSAAEFINEQRDCIAIVVSEDKKVSVISWDQSREMVKVTKNFEWMIFD